MVVLAGTYDVYSLASQPFRIASAELVQMDTETPRFARNAKQMILIAK